MKPFEWARAVSEDPHMPPPARHVAAVLALHSKGMTSRCSYEQLAQWTGLHRATVIRHMGTLEARGWIVRVHQRRKTGARAATLYMLVPPVDNSLPTSHSATLPTSHSATGVVAQRDPTGVAQRDPIKEKDCIKDGGHDLLAVVHSIGQRKAL